LGLIGVILLIGGSLFRWLEPEKNLSLAEATYYTWSLVFGEPPEAFPKSRVLQSLFFLVPVLGLTVIIEAIVDFALLLGDRRKCERSWCATMAHALKNHIVLVGFGRLGYRTYRLLRRLGEAVVVIERDPNGQFLEELRREGAPLLIGDARREALLEDANVADARSVILATNDDLANLEIALDARRISPNVRVVLRMFDQHMADKIRDGFNIHIAMSQSALSAPAFATAALEPSIVNSIIVGNRLVVVQRWNVQPGGSLCDRTVSEILATLGICVIERRPRDEPGCLFPSPDTTLSAGDEVLLQGPLDTIASIRASSVGAA
jgi:Trk K+ transport system NAD-binding subunit